MSAASDRAKWERLRTLFERAKDLKDDEMADYFATCGADADEQREIRGLLEAHRSAGSFLQEPAHTATDEYLGLLLNGRYTIAHLLGQGGFGRVYLGHDHKLADRTVVIKFLMPGSSQSESGERRYQAEMEALARLNHPGIVAIYDTGTAPDGKFYIVMQHVEGVSLAEALRAGPLDATRAARLLRQIGQALEAAHNAGVCHRDIKPGNIMLSNYQTPAERAVLVDFGIAAVREGEGPESLTVPAGSPAYMAPERLLGKSLPSSDLYSLGITVLEMLTGKHVMQLDADVPSEAVRAHLPSACPSLQPEFARKLARALELDPTERPACAAVFTNELAGLLEHRGSRRRFRFGLATAAMVLGSLLTIWAARDTLTLFSGADTFLTAGVTPWQVARTDTETGDGATRILVGPRFMIDHGLRLTLQFSRSGYIYIVSRELYTDGAKGKPNLLAPTARLRAGNNRVEAGIATDLPSNNDSPPYWSVAPSDSRVIAELITVIHSPHLLPEVVLQEDTFELSDELFSRWEREFEQKKTTVEMFTPAGVYRPPAELVRKLRLRQQADESTPTTVHLVKADAPRPALITIKLQVQDEVGGMKTN